MNLERVKKLLKEKEHIRLEFKEAKSALPVNLFETICAMLNRDGGDILLGVSDSGVVVGIDPASTATLSANLVNLSNNPQKLDSPFILYPQIYRIDGKSVIHIQVPCSSQVHQSAGSIYDRSYDGDFRVVHPQRIAEIYNRKRTHYTENIVYPALRFSDFKEALFPKIKNLIRNNNANHPWLALSDEHLLEKAGLWKRDFQTGQEGYTLASALLLGKNEVIQQILPHYKIDALVRIVDKERFDDRLYIQTNLVEAYEHIMDLTAKHLPDKFFLRNDQRISLRTLIFREVNANLIVHREYTSASPCTFIIHPDRVETENANNPHGEGPIDPTNFAPYPKNPTITQFFIQLGRVDDLGSGVLNVNRHINEYSGKRTSEFIEEPVFKMIIPVPEKRSDRQNEGLNEELNEGLKTLFAAISGKPGSQAKDLPALLNDRPLKTIERQIQSLVTMDLVERRGSRKTGGYFSKTKN